MSTDLRFSVLLPQFRQWYVVSSSGVHSGGDVKCIPKNFVEKKVPKFASSLFVKKERTIPNSSHICIP